MKKSIITDEMLSSYWMQIAHPHNYTGCVTWTELLGRDSYTPIPIFSHYRSIKLLEGCLFLMSLSVWTVSFYVCIRNLMFIFILECFKESKYIFMPDENQLPSVCNWYILWCSPSFTSRNTLPNVASLWIVNHFFCDCMLVRIVGSILSGFWLVAFSLMCFAEKPFLAFSIGWV